MFSKHIKYFGIDFLEFVHNHSRIKFKIEKSIDDDNSNFGYIDLYGLTFTYTRVTPKGYIDGYSFSCSYKNKSVPCFAVLFGGKKGKIMSRDKVVFYSGFFVLEQNQFLGFKIKDFLEKYFYMNKIILTRLDIALDLSMKLTSILKLFSDKFKFHSTIGNDEKYKGFFQTYYTSEIQNTKNKTKQIRLYDKVLDSFKKNKSFLFPHLKENSEIRRLELELRENACRQIKENLLDILDNKDNYMSNLFKKHLSKYIPTIPKVKLDLIPYKKHISTLSEDFLTLGHIPNGYMQRANGYVKKILDNTGQKGFLQLLLGAYFDNPPLREGIDGTSYFIPTRQEPLFLLDSLIEYYKTELNIPEWLIYKHLNLKQKPKIMIKEVQKIFT